MQKKSNLKINVLIFSFAFIAVFAMSVGSFYVYYINKVKYERSGNLIVKSTDMWVNFEKTDQINISTLKKGLKSNIKFSIENQSDNVGKYSIYLDIISPLSDEPISNFIYSINGIAKNLDHQDRLINSFNKQVPVSSIEIGSGLISSNNIHKYEFKMEVLENLPPEFTNKLFACKIRVESSYN